MAEGRTTDLVAGGDARPEVVAPGVSGTRLRRGAVGTALFLVAWTGVAALYPPYVLPSPAAVAAAFALELTTPAPYAVPVIGTEVTATKMVATLLESLQHYVPGLLLGIAFGAPLGIAMGWSRRLDEHLSVIVQLLRPVPPLAWMGLVIVWIGIGHAGAAFIVSIGSFWITFFSAYDGVERLDDAYLDVGRSLGVDDDLGMIRKVVVPGVAPDVATGIRTSIGRCWMIVVAAELFGAPGVGYRIIQAAQSLSMDVSMAYMAAMSLVYFGSDAAFCAIRQGVQWR
ncbi:MAG: ABC transporter permease subunit [Haloferacaceae archaeon]